MEGSPLAVWESFYVIAGSSGAALTGLQFVVIALVADLRPEESNLEIAAFGTPNIVHFCAVLLVSCILSAPWPTMTSAAVALGSCGTLGIAYTLIVIRRALRQTAYEPVLEDWLSYGVLPIIAYTAVLIGAIELETHTMVSLFAIAGAVMLLLFIGIHNAWDTVTYLVIQRPKPPMEPSGE